MTSTGPRRATTAALYLARKIARPVGHWSAHGLCRKSDPDMFFPEPDEQQIAEAAKLICDQCPVAKLCLAEAIGRNEKYGIWSGTTERQRRRMHTTMRPAEPAA